MAAQEKRKEEEKIAEEKRLAEIEDKLAKQEYIGSIGEKIELEVKVVFSKIFFIIIYLVLCGAWAIILPY